MTYLQHWGLAEPEDASIALQPIAWEEDCRFQAWVTLHISFHQQHHLQPGIPYYRLGMASASPRLPAGYIVMMVLCLSPRLWRAAMIPVLERWREQPHQMPSADRGLTCFWAYRRKDLA